MDVLYFIFWVNFLKISDCIFLVYYIYILIDVFILKICFVLEIGYFIMYICKKFVLLIEIINCEI